MLDKVIIAFIQQCTFLIVRSTWNLKALVFLQAENFKMMLATGIIEKVITDM
jgi:hypothetical protein